MVCLPAKRLKLVELHCGHRRLGVRDKRETRAFDFLQLFVHTRPRALRRRRQATEMIADLLLDGINVEITDRDHAHQVRAIPVAVEATKGLVVELPQHLDVTDRQSFRVARTLEQHGQLLVAHARTGTETQPPFLDHNAALFVDLLAIESDVVCPVLQNLKGCVDDFLAIGRDDEEIVGVVKAGRSVHVGTEPHPERLEDRHEFLLGKMLGAVERHVLHEVRQAELVLVLLHRTHAHNEPQLGAFGGIRVLADPEAQAVIELADADARVHRHVRIQRCIDSIARVGNGREPVDRLGSLGDYQARSGKGAGEGEQSKKAETVHGQSFGQTGSPSSSMIEHWPARV